MTLKMKFCGIVLRISVLFAFALLWGVLVSGEAGAQIPNAFVPVYTLDENCTATVQGRTVQVNPNGTFAISGPLPVGQYRVRVVCEVEGGILLGQSDFMEGDPSGVTPVSDIYFGNVEPVAVSLDISSRLSQLTLINPTAQVSVISKYSDGSQRYITGSAWGTTYTTTNPAIAIQMPAPSAPPRWWASGFVTAEIILETPPSIQLIFHFYRFCLVFLKLPVAIGTQGEPLR